MSNRRTWSAIVVASALAGAIPVACSDEVELQPDGFVVGGGGGTGSGGSAGSGSGSGSAAVTDAIPPIGVSPVRVATQTVAAGFTAPLLATPAPGIPQSLFVVDQIGVVTRVDLATGQKSTFLDVRSLLVPLGIASLGGYDERGLLGLAFDPQFATTGLFYTYTSEPVTGIADFTFPRLGDACPTPPSSLAPDHQNVVREWRATGTPPTVGVLATSRVVMRIDWPNFGHNGGMLAFGPDNLLYISLGDGGGEDDQTCQIGIDGTTTIGHSTSGNAQDLGVAYGKLFRIDPHGRISANGMYSVPASNPFVITPGVLPEIYASGLRDFFRFSFDRLSGLLIGGDNGENDIEEVDVIHTGGNYGWRQKEGTGLFDPAGFALIDGKSDGHVVKLSPASPPSFVDPIAQYAHVHAGVSQGRAVIGGLIYRGNLLRALRGQYVFGDYTQDQTMTAAGRLLVLGQVTGTAQQPVDSLLATPLDIFTLGFGEDATHELYVLGNRTGTPQGVTGELRRIIPAP